jgi:hypothetical protein
LSAVGLAHPERDARPGFEPATAAVAGPTPEIENRWKQEAAGALALSRAIAQDDAPFPA